MELFRGLLGGGRGSVGWCCGGWPGSRATAGSSGGWPCGHRRIDTTMGYKATYYPEEAIEAHRASPRHPPRSRAAWRTHPLVEAPAEEEQRLPRPPGRLQYRAEEDRVVSAVVDLGDLALQPGQ